MHNFKVFITLALLCVSTLMPGQNLPPLQKDGNITTGQLQNGISYYLVNNPKLKGVADFALILNGKSDTADARKDLASLHHFNKTKPYKFLARKGIGCRPEGYISYPDGATLYRFDDVPIIDQASSDSTLLMIFDIIYEHSFPCAIIISGDINVGNLVNRMTVFSMSVPKRNPTNKKEKYSWKPSGAMKFNFSPSETTSVNLDLRSPRTPEGMMNTIQPFITSIYVKSLELIIKSRLVEASEARSIPVLSLSSEYVNSSMTAEDEHLKIRFGTAKGHMIQASLCLASTVAELAKNGVTKAEYKIAMGVIHGYLSESQDNSDMVEKCVASYLHGSDLATMASKLNYISSRNLNSDVELDLFNNYVKALLDNPENLNISCSGSEDECDEWTRETAFGLTWNAVSALENIQYPWTISDGDTLMIGKKRSKTKLKSSSPDAFSGGEAWTFGNGMKVIFKQQPLPSKEFSFSLLINGGFSTVKDLAIGEGAFFSDMLWLYDIAGMSGYNFQKVLKANNVNLKSSVTLSDMRLYGSAPSDKFLLVMKALTSVANDRSLNTAAFESYKSLEKPQRAVLDSLMYTGYKYSLKKTPAGLADRTQMDADEYFERQFIKTNDGVLVIVGDLSKEGVRKILESYLGAFRISKVVPGRPAIQYKYRQGDVTFSSSGDDKMIDIGIATALPFTTENNIAFLAAALQLHQTLSGKMAENGFYVEMTPNLKLYPMESVELIFNCQPVPECGLPLGVDSGSENPMRALNVAKKVITDVLAKPITDGELKAYKILLSNRYSASIAVPSRFIDAILLRYAYGKDILTDYGNRINGITAEKVNQVKKALLEGMRIEYVVK
ncbi:MAG: hypothetical protein PUK70_00440 [Bacteroidales bacterium]|nr:hypothetical protein [Bacteroidales bacterium]MDY6002268.1 hypothetical protein [Candidatus Cryptobacteroides sp.]